MDENLHSLNELEKNIQSMKLLSFFLSRDKRKQLQELEAQVNNFKVQPQTFNDNFSDLGWCAYESMNFSLMEKANLAAKNEGLDAGERILLDYYKNDVNENVRYFRHKTKSFAERFDLLSKAFDDHFAGRYHASVPLFLIIIDGAVNDFTKSKGFFAEGTDVTAWDCLVGCSEGLTKLKGIFNKGRNVTNHAEIRLPYRNGILHGRDLNYANEYVSCKCVSLIFALADWMNMKESEESRKAKFEKETNPPPLSESIKKLRQNKIDREEIQKWQKRIVTIGTDIPSAPTIEDCAMYPYVIPLLNAFSAWGRKNYGELSVYLKNMFSYESSEKKRAGECRKAFHNKEFQSFELKEIEERSCCLTRISVQVNWKVGEQLHSETLEFGSMYQDETDKFAYPWKNNGDWVLYPWDIRGLNA